MALVFEDTTCPICNEKLDRPYMGTSGVVFPQGHPLAPYCDAPLHFDCLETWPYRIEFSQAYFNYYVKRYEDGCGHYGYILKKETDWIFATGPCVIDGYPYCVTVHFREWPYRLYSHWDEWDVYVLGEYRKELAGNAVQVANQVMKEITILAPDLVSLERLLKQKQ